MKKLTLSSSPHIFSRISTNYIMWIVILALLPATLSGIYYFGVKALLVILTSIVSAILTEIIIQKIKKQKITIKDGSAIITGLLLALVIPSSVPLWIPAAGAIFAIAIGKHVFGGLGHNIFNPALVGRAFLLISFPVLMTAWLIPSPGFTLAGPDSTIDAITAATPLGVLKEEGYTVLSESFSSNFNMYTNLFIGNIGGSIGETNALAILLGGLFLLYLRIIKWHIPVIYIGTVGILSFLLGADPLFHMLAGGLMLGAFFMATDYVTNPMTTKGKIIFAVGCGIVTIYLRFYSAIPEGVSYSILFMNGLTPMIDRYTIPRVFGYPESKFMKIIKRLRIVNKFIK